MVGVGRSEDFDEKTNIYLDNCSVFRLRCEYIFRPSLSTRADSHHRRIGHSMLRSSWSDFSPPRATASTLGRVRPLEDRITPASVVSIANQTFNLAAGMQGFQVTRTGDLTVAADVGYTITAGTAIAGTNFTALPAGTVHFDAGQATAQIPLTILSNNFPEVSRLLTVDLTQALGGQTTMATGGNPRSVVAADFNLDTLPDLVVVNGNDNTVSVFINTTVLGSAPTFSPRVDFATGTGPFFVAVADVDGDLLPDIVVADNQDNTVSVLINTTVPLSTTPSFAAAVPFAAGFGPVSVAAVDVNGDGLADLITADQFDNTLSVLINTTLVPGTPTFDPAVPYLVDTSPATVAVADIDGDGFPDLIAGSLGYGTIQVLLNDGTGNFAAPVTFNQAANGIYSAIYAVTTADIDGDGLLDIVAASLLNDRAIVLRNTSTMGNVGFAAPVGLPVGAGPSSVTAADIDGDGLLDLLVADQNAGTLTLLRNTSTPGTISFEPRVAFPSGVGATGTPFAVTTADIDGDGTPDVIAANLNNATVSVLLNNVTISPAATRPATATIDGAPVAVSVVPAGTSPTNAATVNFTVTFSEAVTGLTAANFVVTGTATGATVGTPTTADGGLTYTVPVNVGGDGTLGLSLTSRTGVTDSAANQLYQTQADDGTVFTGLGSTGTYAIDRTAPTVSIGAPSAPATAGGPVSFVVTYADANLQAVRLTAADVTLNATGTTGTISVVNNGGTYVVTVSNVTGNGTLGISIAAGTAIDTAGNLAPAAGPSAAFVVDNTNPRVSSIVLSDGGTSSPGSATLTVTLTEPVSGLSAANFSLTGSLAGASSFNVIAPAPGAFVSTIQVMVTIGGTGTGTLGLSLSDGTGVSDSTGNVLAGLPASSALLTFTTPVPAPTPPPVPVVRYTAVGSGPGGATEVKVYLGSALAGDFFASDPAFAGGVTVATGDVNGDNVEDIIIGIGAGGLPVVIVVDGTKLGQIQANGRIADSALITTFFAFDPSFRGGVNVGSAHLQAGPASQILVGAGAGGLPIVQTFGVTGGVAIQIGGPTGAFFAFDGAFSGGVTVAAADFTGAGTDQIVVGAGPGGLPIVRVLRPSDLSELRSYFAFPAGFAGGVSVAAGDITGSGVASVVVGAGPGGLPAVSVFNFADGSGRQLFAQDLAFRGGSAVAVGDINGDGRPDVVAGPGPITAGTLAARRVRAFDGLTLAEVGGFDNPFGLAFLGGVSVG